jgi:hypothetical protein
MNTLDELRRVLEAGAGDAPSPDGVVTAAQRGAARIRRRRRVLAAGGVAALVTVVALVVPLVTARRHADGPPPASTPAGRAAGQVTLGVAAGFEVTSQDVDARGQRITFRVPPAGSATSHLTAGATAIDADAGFDPARLRSGERTTVSGHEAWYVPDYPLAMYVTVSSWKMRRQAEPTPVLGWQDRTGTWVLVHPFTGEELSRAQLIEAAHAVRIDPPSELTLPVGLARPDEFPWTRAESDRRTYARIVLGGTAAPPDATMVVGAAPGTTIIIEAWPSGDHPVRGAPAAPVAGHDAWYSKNTLGSALGNGTLWVRAGGCTVSFTAWDADRASASQLREIAAAATYADCDDPATWVPAVHR